MKLKIKQDGLCNYTGYLQTIHFTNGISDRDVKHNEAIRISVVMACVWEDGSEVSRIVDNTQISAPIGRVTRDVYVKTEVVAGNDSDHPEFIHHEEKPKDAVSKTIVEVLPPAEEVPEIIVRYTRDELEKIADEKGINGLRDVATPLGIRDTSIRRLIERIYAIAGKEE